MGRLVGVMLVLAIFAITSARVAAHEGAGFGFRVKDSALEFDPQAVPADHFPGYKLVKEKCTKCHNQERIVRCLQDCYNYGKDYEISLRELISRKIRLVGSNVSKEEGKSILEFLMAMYKVEVKEHSKKK